MTEPTWPDELPPTPTQPAPDDPNPTDPPVPAPTDAARILHGEDAAVETHDQPETVDLPAETKIAKPADDGE
jgi:hypothetical protein